MLFISMYTWNQDKRNEIIARRLEKGRMVPKGIKVLGEWTAIGQPLGILLFETDNQNAMAEMNIAWNDILESEIVPVLDTEKDLLGLLKK